MGSGALEPGGEWIFVTEGREENEEEFGAAKWAILERLNRGIVESNETCVCGTRNFCTPLSFHARGCEIGTGLKMRMRSRQQNLAASCCSQGKNGKCLVNGSDKMLVRETDSCSNSAKSFTALKPPSRCHWRTPAPMARR